MNESVELPVWLLVVVLALAAIAALDRIIGPGVRWYLRRRMERVVARLNTRLQRPIEPFRLARRKDTVTRLSYDPRVLEAVAEHAAETGVPPSVAFAEAEGYAREIVPGFSASLYFGFATRAARWLSRFLYRVRIGRIDAALAHIDPRSTVIFVMNHRSNMDYVLITWLVAERTSLSYAVGEWARVWPLSGLIRSMGAFFIRRNSKNPLYRRVLARYVQIATSEGTTQAMFPEGGLSLDGRVGAARMGLLSYILAGFDPAGRDVVFVPVGLAYDRVLEDRLLTEAAAAGTRRFRARPLSIAAFVARMFWRRLRGRFHGFGTVAAGFGAPLSLRAWVAKAPDRSAEALGDDLMARIGRAVPVVPVPLVAAAVALGPVARADLPARVQAMAARLQAQGAVLALPREGDAAEAGVVPLIARGILAEGPDGLVARDMALHAFYAAAVLQMLDEDAATPQT
ncbi:MAG TPA: 1-acyl-sn-glycerol-3-phosphate acyltransferase [Paracoccaceae bacterium]|nr:1-acyl-sn-glycerol-3-phosphate acyltransferase [Paracoccaceae bacterium]